MSTVVKIGTEFQVNSQTTGGQWYPSVTGLANGGFVVTWQDGLAGYNGSGSSSLSCTALSSASDGTPASSGRAKARGSPWCRRRATGGSAVG